MPTDFGSVPKRRSGTRARKPMPSVPRCIFLHIVELEYRFLEATLVLVDLHAGLIVDFNPRARDHLAPPGGPPAWPGRQETFDM